MRPLFRPRPSQCKNQHLDSIGLLLSELSEQQVPDCREISSCFYCICISGHQTFKMHCVGGVCALFTCAVEHELKQLDGQTVLKLRTQQTNSHLTGCNLVPRGFPIGRLRSKNHCTSRRRLVNLGLLVFQPFVSLDRGGKADVARRTGSMHVPAGSAPVPV